MKHYISSYITSVVVVVAHLASINIPSLSIQTIYNASVDLFCKKEIPWSDCLAMLMDSCNVMRECKSGLEKTIQEIVFPNILDIDGGTHHQIHNSCKKFAS